MLTSDSPLELSPLDAEHIVAVLEDCVDQLAVLGSIISTPDQPADSAPSPVDEIAKILNGQRQLEGRYEELILNDGPRANAEISSIKNNMKSSAQGLIKTVRQNPLAAENLIKLQQDREYLQMLITDCLEECCSEGSFEGLIRATVAQRERKTNLQDTILREEDARKNVRALQRQLVELRRSKELEIQSRNEMIAHLKDQLQETRAKTSMERKYIEKECQVQKVMRGKQCTLEESELQAELDRLQMSLEEENRVNGETELWVKKHHAQLQEKVEFWMEKYEAEVDQKSHELSVLKASKATDLLKLQELTKKYIEYEEVVLDDRAQKEKAKKAAEKAELEIRCATKIQAWWKGVMVRKGLGAYAKKKKGKKGK